LLFEVVDIQTLKKDKKKTAWTTPCGLILLTKRKVVGNVTTKVTPAHLTCTGELGKSF